MTGRSGRWRCGEERRLIKERFEVVHRWTQTATRLDLHFYHSSSQKVAVDAMDASGEAGGHFPNVSRLSGPTNRNFAFAVQNDDKRIIWTQQSTTKSKKQF